MHNLLGKDRGIDRAVFRRTAKLAIDLLVFPRDAVLGDVPDEDPELRSLRGNAQTRSVVGPRLIGRTASRGIED